MHTTWVIAADASRARIFEMSDGVRQFHEIDVLLNPQGRQDERELRTDAKGRYFDKGNLRGGQQPASTTEPKVDQGQHEAEVFSKRLGDFVGQARHARRFDKLCVIAPPKFLGLIRQNLDEQSRKLVTDEIPKDLAWFEGRDIADYLRAHLH